jgi:hypothetical protein
MFVRMVTILTVTTQNVGEDVEQGEPSFIAYKNAKWHSYSDVTLYYFSVCWYWVLNSGSYGC